MKLANLAIGLALASLFFPATPSYAAHRVALVVGNANYQTAPALAKSEDNAKAIADMFRQAGFDVVTAQFDVTATTFNKVVTQFQSEAAGSDIAVIYFSGYGVAVNGANLLLPVDASAADVRGAGASAIRLDALANAVTGAKRLRLVLVDALHGDPFIAAKPSPGGRAPSAEGGLTKPSPPVGTLIAYAAAAGTTSEEGDGAQSIYTSAVLRNLFTPGLDIRLAFGRVLIEVQKNTQGRQTPFVYGSLGGGNISLVPPPVDRPMVDLAGEKTDYRVVELINTALAWEVFMVQHPTGFYVSVARERLRLVETEAAAPPSEPAPEPAPPLAPSPTPVPTPAPTPAPPRTVELEQPPVQRGGQTLPEVGSPALVSLAQQELARLGCYSGADAGTLDQATRDAISRYEKATGQAPGTVADITRDFIATLEQQKNVVCPTTCPAGQVLHGNQCVEVGRSPPVAARGVETLPKRIARPTPAPAPSRPAASGAPARSPITTGVGF